MVQFLKSEVADTILDVAPRVTGKFRLPEHLCDDVVGMTAEKVFAVMNRFPSYRRAMRDVAYRRNLVARMARQSAIDLYRKNRSRRERPLPDGDDIGPATVFDLDAIDARMAAELVAKVAKNLDTEARVVLAMLIGGKSIDDMAAKAGCTVRTMRDRFVRGVRALRSALRSVLRKEADDEVWETFINAIIAARNAALGSKTRGDDHD